MTKTKTYKSDAFAAIHETATGMCDAGVIDMQTMRCFDRSCLTPIRDFTGDDVRALRVREGVSQAVFAHYLNVTKDYVSKWERGEKKPTGTCLELLSIVERKGLASIT
ncbi:MAG: DNA-binding transcriptional regulator [Magnetococcales bacterium]|nr:DNA-binding transcriptional regulator [Magnetococcales bacterium]MBF0323075.1 DNA-binding transcriptional regulator [Magnetococcales bacterium]